MIAGIEIGGTKLQLGLGPGDGTFVAFERRAVEPQRGGGGIREQIVEAWPKLLQSAGCHRDDVRAIGIGFGGPVDDRTRSTIKSHQVEGWDNFPLAHWAEQELGRPTVVGNDADCAGLAEAMLGAGRGFDPVFYITVGSGIGGGLIVGQRVQRGTGLGAAEMGHLRLRTAEGYSTLEDLCSGWALERTSGLNARELAQRYAQGDGAIQSFLNERWRYLAEAINHVITLVCPSRIIIGGGVSLMGEEVLFRPLREFVAAHAFAPFANCYEIVPAVLGEEMVVHGAMLMASQHANSAATDITFAIATRPPL